MKHFDKVKTQNLVDKIESSEFSPGDVDALLIKLRPHYQGKKLFLEITHFVAHPETRDKGYIHGYLEKLTLFHKFMTMYATGRNALDLYEPFPAWIKRLLLRQAEYSDPKNILNRIGISKERLLDLLKKSIEVDSKTKSAFIQLHKMKNQLFESINFLLGSFSVDVVYTQDLFLDDLIQVLSASKLKVNEELIRAQADKLTISLIMLIHQSEFEFSDNLNGRCEIAVRQKSSNDEMILERRNDKLELLTDFEPISMMAILPDGDNFGRSLIVPIIETSLKAEIWCAPNLFEYIPIPAEPETIYFKKFKLDDRCVLQTQDNFVLTQIAR